MQMRANNVEQSQREMKLNNEKAGRRDVDEETEIEIEIERDRERVREREERYSFFKWAIPYLFLIYFRLFSQKLQFLQQICVKKCPSSI